MCFFELTGKLDLEAGLSPKVKAKCFCLKVFSRLRMGWSPNPSEKNDLKNKNNMPLRTSRRKIISNKCCFCLSHGIKFPAKRERSWKLSRGERAQLEPLPGCLRVPSWILLDVLITLFDDVAFACSSLFFLEALPEGT